MIALDTEVYFWNWVELRNLLHAVSDGPGAECAELVAGIEAVYWKWADGVWAWIRSGQEDVRRAEGVVRGVLESAGRRGWRFQVRMTEEGCVYYFFGQEGGEEKVIR